MTVAELAKKVGISQSMLSNYENGNSQPRDQKTWRKLSNILDVEVSYLMGFSNQRSISLEQFNALEKNNASEKNIGAESASFKQKRTLYYPFKGEPTAYLIDEDIPIQVIYDELSEEKKEVLYTVGQALFTSQMFENSLVETDDENSD